MRARDLRRVRFRLDDRARASRRFAKERDARVSLVSHPAVPRFRMDDDDALESEDVFAVKLCSKVWLEMFRYIGRLEFLALSGRIFGNVPVRGVGGVVRVVIKVDGLGKRGVVADIAVG